MQSEQKCRCTLLRICFDTLLQLSCLKKMLTSDIFSKCLGIVRLQQRKFTLTPVLTNRKIFYLPSIRETNLKSGYNKSLAGFLTHKAIRILYSLLSKSFSITSEMRFEKSTAFFEVITGFPVLSSISFRAFPATSPPSFATLLFSEND